MKKFDNLKAEFIEILRDKSPFASEYKKVLQSTTQAELLAVIFNNSTWCVENKAITNEFLMKFDAEDLLTSGLLVGRENAGLLNSGNRNSGNRNSGNRNSGNWNSGNWNSGDSNSGNWNSGNWNSGDSNSGNRNSGNWNSGNWNSGNRNSGNRNSGNRNSGYSNSGNRNSGDSNSGNWNSGNRNSGDSNSGYRNSGAFCTDPNPKLVLFDVQTEINVRDWENHPACQIMNNLNPTIWVCSSEMTVAEKTKFPSHETTEGYLKSIPYKEAWLNLWGNLSEENKLVFTSLPNFNSDKFKEITGIAV